VKGSSERSLGKYLLRPSSQDAIIKKLKALQIFFDNDRITVNQKGRYNNYLWAEFYIGAKNKESPQWAYKSQSDGAWHWGRGFGEGGWVLKPSGTHHYVQTTLLAQSVQHVIEASQETQEFIPPARYLSTGTLKAFFNVCKNYIGSRNLLSCQKVKECFDKPIRATEGQLSALRPLVALAQTCKETDPAIEIAKSFEQVIDEMEQDFKGFMPPEHAALSKVRAGGLGTGNPNVQLGDGEQTLYEIEKYIADANSHFLRHQSSMYPNFNEECAERYTFQHSILREVQVKVFRSPDGHLWHMARAKHEGEQKFWINRVVVPDATLTNKGTYDVYPAYGALLSKPVEYYAQTNVIPWTIFQNRIDRRGPVYVDLTSAFIHRFTVVQNYIDSVSGAPTSFQQIIANHRWFIDNITDQKTLTRLVDQLFNMIDKKNHQTRFCHYLSKSSIFHRTEQFNNLYVLKQTKSIWKWTVSFWKWTAQEQVMYLSTMHSLALDFLYPQGGPKADLQLKVEEADALYFDKYGVTPSETKESTDGLNGPPPLPRWNK